MPASPETFASRHLLNIRSFANGDHFIISSQTLICTLTTRELQKSKSIGCASKCAVKPDARIFSQSHCPNDRGSRSHIGTLIATFPDECSADKFTVQANGLSWICGWRFPRDQMPGLSSSLCSHGRPRHATTKPKLPTHTAQLPTKEACFVAAVSATPQFSMSSGSSFVFLAPLCMCVFKVSKLSVCGHIPPEAPSVSKLQVLAAGDLHPPPASPRVLGITQSHHPLQQKSTVCDRFSSPRSSCSCCSSLFRRLRQLSTPAASCLSIDRSHGKSVASNHSAKKLFKIVEVHPMAQQQNRRHEGNTQDMPRNLLDMSFF